jgi:hypothetical protein
MAVLSVLHTTHVEPVTALNPGLRFFRLVPLLALHLITGKLLPCHPAPIPLPLQVHLALAVHILALVVARLFLSTLRLMS